METTFPTSIIQQREAVRASYLAGSLSLDAYVAADEELIERQFARSEELLAPVLTVWEQRRKLTARKKFNGPVPGWTYGSRYIPSMKHKSIFDQ